MPAAEFTWVVPAAHPAFPGHFPGHPIVPGVVLLDQAIRFAQSLLSAPVARWQIGVVKFQGPAGPSDTLVFSLERAPHGAIAFTVTSGARAIATGSLTPVAP